MKPKTKSASFADQLQEWGACYEAVEWVGDRSLAAAWRECPRADWMLWLLARARGWSREALNAFLLDSMALALKSARAVAGAALYWPSVEAAHLQVANAVRTGEGLIAAAESAASAARAGRAAARAAESAAARAAESAAWSAAASVAKSAAWSAAESAAWSMAASVAESAAWSAAESAARITLADCLLADCLRRHFPRAPRLGGRR